MKRDNKKNKASSLPVNQDTQEIVEFIPDDKWNLWLKTLTEFVTDLDGVINVLELLGRIKYKIENCSRSYAAMWTLDTLLECWKMNEASLDVSFKSSIDRLQREWNYIYELIKDQRKEFLAIKCISFFDSQCKDKNEILSVEEYNTIINSSITEHDKWVNISKIAHEKGWTNKPSYKQFLGQLMIEMTKY